MHSQPTPTDSSKGCTRHDDLCPIVRVSTFHQNSSENVSKICQSPTDPSSQFILCRNAMWFQFRAELERANAFYLRSTPSARWKGKNDKTIIADTKESKAMSLFIDKHGQAWPD